MKRILISLSALALTLFPARADEGMWLLPLLQKMNAKAMTELGCRLSAEDIYSINHASLKDAIVQFGGGCTGEIISGEGLLVTNHHCGYSSIQRLSSPDHNYLEDGYWAMNRNQELPVPGLTVTFLEYMTDVTSILDKVYDETLRQMKDSADASALAEKARMEAGRQLAAQAEADHPFTEAGIQSFYNENVYYLIVYKIYKDVRFVGAPPASIGKFGGETDNWMWPRHTGDFSMFRVYAGADNQPADYSPENRPYVPKRALKVSLKGVADGDFAFIMGYPGSTQRFQTAVQLQDMMDVHDISIAARTVRQDLMWEAMEADPAVRLQYANKYAGSANGWKKWRGEKLAFEKLDIIDREERKEAEFMKWVGKNKKRTEKYGKALEDIEAGARTRKQPREDLTLLTESAYQVGPVGVASAFIQGYVNALHANPDTVAAMAAAWEAARARLKDYHEPLERKEAVALLSFYRQHARPERYLQGLGGDFATMDFGAYVDTLFAGSAFASLGNLEAAAGRPYSEMLQDPAMVLHNAVTDQVYALYPVLFGSSDVLERGSKAFGAGLMEWKKGEPSYPDANFTMRLTYGTVKSYSPRDGVLYKHYTTLDGVMEKEDPGNYEFRVPARLKELYEKQDFGPYAGADGKVPACFLTNNDITGGNSGSPVLDADGQLIGLAFDGNWESMSSDVMFEPDLQRCICVDIRYVLFLVDKFGGAGYLLKEMDLVR